MKTPSHGNKGRTYKNKVALLVRDGMTATGAFDVVAERYGVQPGTVQAAYYKFGRSRSSNRKYDTTDTLAAKLHEDDEIRSEAGLNMAQLVEKYDVPHGYIRKALRHQRTLLSNEGEIIVCDRAINPPVYRMITDDPEATIDYGSTRLEDVVGRKLTPTATFIAAREQLRRVAPGTAALALAEGLCISSARVDEDAMRLADEIARLDLASLALV